MEFGKVVRKRYACKKYSSKKVEREKLEAVLEAGRLAPTAKNLQEQHIYVLESQEALDKFDIETPCRYGAKTVIVVAFDKDNVYRYPGGQRDSGIEDASIVATHMMLVMLAATDQGLNSCWINFLDPDKLAKALELPENEEILMALDLGYAAEDAEPLANHFSRKELSETVSYL